MCTQLAPHCSGWLNQFSPEHWPAAAPSRHSYCVTFVQPGSGLHVHSGRPGCMSPSLMAIATSSASRGGSVLALTGFSYSSVTASGPTTISSQMHRL